LAINVANALFSATKTSEKHEIVVISISQLQTVVTWGFLIHISLIHVVSNGRNGLLLKMPVFKPKVSSIENLNYCIFKLFTTTQIHSVIAK